MKFSGRRTWTEKQFREAVKKSSSFQEVILHLGLRPAGGNFGTVKLYVEKFGCSIEHFKNVDKTRGLRLCNQLRQKWTHENTLVSDSKNRKIRKYVLQHKLLEYRCQECGQEPIFRGKPLSLQLDHINGIYNDNRLENLRFLCPNCHSQTVTFAGKNCR